MGFSVLSFLSQAASKKKQTPKNLLSKESVLVEKPSPNTSICPVLVPSKNDAEDGMWNLSLDKAPTPGVNLMLFVPVCSQSDSLPLSSSISANFGMDTFVVGQIAPTVNLVTSNMVEECEAPLDLSQRSAVGNTPLGTVRKPLKVDVEEGHSIQRQDFKNGDSKVTSNVKPEEADNGTAEILKSEPTDLTSSEMILDVKTEPEHQASGLYPSTTHNLTRYQPDKEIKMEVDISPWWCWREVHEMEQKKNSISIFLTDCLQKSLSSFYCLTLFTLKYSLKRFELHLKIYH